MGNYQTHARPEIKSTFTSAYLRTKNGNKYPGNYVFLRFVRYGSNV